MTKAALIILALRTVVSAAHLTQAADREFGVYVANLEGRLVEQHKNPKTHVATLNLAGNRTAVERQLTSGDLRIEPVGKLDLPGALLHHWRGAAFVANATAAEMVALLRDYDHLSKFYAPEITASRAVKDDGETAILAVRLKERRVRTIVLDAEYRVEATLAGRDRGYSSSRSTRIWQVDNAWTPHERRRTPGDDEGFLWRLNSYWSFERGPGGLWIECEAVSLTRDVPMGLGWLITPIIQELPSDALQFTLRATRNALLAIAAGKGQP